MNDTLTIRLGAKLASALEEEARHTGLAKGHIVRQALQSRLKRNGGLTVMSRYFGAMQGPADLGTKKAHRRDWGGKKR